VNKVAIGISEYHVDVATCTPSCPTPLIKGSRQSVL